MRRVLVPGLFFLALVLVSAAPAQSIEELIRQGNEAFHAEQYKEALELYQKAEELSTDPGLVAYNKALTLYKLGQYREAELHFRRALEDAKGLRQTQSLYGLGNSLLMQGGDTSVKLLKDAIKCYQLCRQHPDTPAELHQQAKHNLELAKLLLIKALINQAQNPENQGGNDAQKPKHQGPDGSSNNKGNGQDNPEPDPSQDPQNIAEGSDPKSKSKTKLPQRGNPPVIPDEGKLVPITAEDMNTYLEQLAERILQDSKKAKGGKSNPSQQVKDW